MHADTSCMKHTVILKLGGDKDSARAIYLDTVHVEICGSRDLYYIII